jgi:hypothetical protein
MGRSGMFYAFIAAASAFTVAAVVALLFIH